MHRKHLANHICSQISIGFQYSNIIEGIQLEFLNVHEFFHACSKRTKMRRAKPTDAQSSQTLPGVTYKAGTGRLRGMKT